MSISHVAEYPDDPKRVFEVLTNEDFLREYAKELRATECTVEVTAREDGVDTQVHMMLPTTGIASIFRKLVGAEVPLTDHRSWRGDGHGGYRADLLITAKVFGRTAHIRGQLALVPTEGGSRLSAEAEVDLSVPLIGKQVRQGVGDIAQDAREKEEVLLRRWLSEGPSGTGS